MCCCTAVVLCGRQWDDPEKSAGLHKLNVIGWEHAKVAVWAVTSPPALVYHLDPVDDVVGIEWDLCIISWKRRRAVHVTFSQMSNISEMILCKKWKMMHNSCRLITVFIFFFSNCLMDYKSSEPEPTSLVVVQSPGRGAFVWCLLSSHLKVILLHLGQKLACVKRSHLGWKETLHIWFKVREQTPELALHKHSPGHRSWQPVAPLKKRDYCQSDCFHLPAGGSSWSWEQFGWTEYAADKWQRIYKKRRWEGLKAGVWRTSPTFTWLLRGGLLLIILTPGLSIIHIWLLTPKNTSTGMHVHRGTRRGKPPPVRHKGIHGSKKKYMKCGKMSRKQEIEWNGWNSWLCYMNML